MLKVIVSLLFLSAFADWIANGASQSGVTCVRDDKRTDHKHEARERRCVADRGIQRFDRVDVTLAIAVIVESTGKAAAVSERATVPSLGRAADGLAADQGPALTGGRIVLEELNQIACTRLDRERSVDLCSVRVKQCVGQDGGCLAVIASVRQDDSASCVAVDRVGQDGIAIPVSTRTPLWPLLAMMLAWPGSVPPIWLKVPELIAAGPAVSQGELTVGIHADVVAEDEITVAG